MFRSVSFPATAALAAVSALVGLALMGLRLAGSVSFADPLQITTSGWEQQTLFDIWRYTRGLDLYGDPTRLPYYTGMYNWLFYGAYGEWTRLGLSLLRLDDNWLPTVARSFTLVALPLGAAAAFDLMRRMAGLAGRPALVLAAALAVTLVTGPLLGFWVFTVRPDLWAFVFEMVAVWAFWRLDATQPRAAVAAAALLCFVAWAFKHANLCAAAGLFVFLLSQRRFLGAMALAAIMAGCFGLNVVLAPASYLPSLTQVVLPLAPETGIRNLANFMVKTLPIVLPAACAVLAAGPLRRAMRQDRALTLAVAGSVMSLLLVIPAATKEGASEIYYATPSFFLALLGLTAWRALDAGRSRLAGGVLACSAAGWLLHAVAVLMVVSGLWGVTSMRFLHDIYTAGRTCMDALPKPAYVDDLYLSLPWMNPSQPTVFPSYNYPLLRKKGVEFEAGGIGAMARDGKFAALLLSGEPERLDGAELRGHYVRQPDKCAWRSVFLLTPRED